MLFLRLRGVMKPQWVLGQAGFSLLQVLLLSGLTSIVMLGLVRMVSFSSRATKSAQLNIEFQQLVQRATLVISNVETCRLAFGGKSLGEEIPDQEISITKGGVTQVLMSASATTDPALKLESLFLGEQNPQPAGFPKSVPDPEGGNFDFKVGYLEIKAKKRIEGTESKKAVGAQDLVARIAAGFYLRGDEIIECFPGPVQTSGGEEDDDDDDKCPPGQTCCPPGVSCGNPPPDPCTASGGFLLVENGVARCVTRFCEAAGGTLQIDSDPATPDCAFRQDDQETCKYLGGKYDMSGRQCLFKQELAHKDSYWTDWTHELGYAQVSEYEVWNVRENCYTCKWGHTHCQCNQYTDSSSERRHIPSNRPICATGHYVSAIECDFGDGAISQAQGMNAPIPPKHTSSCGSAARRTRTWAPEGLSHGNWDRCRVRCSTEKRNTTSWWKGAFQQTPQGPAACKWTNWSSWGQEVSCNPGQFLAGLECDSDPTQNWWDDADRCRGCCVDEGSNSKPFNYQDQLQGREFCEWTPMSGRKSNTVGNPAGCPTGSYAMGLRCDEKAKEDADRCQLKCCTAGESSDFTGVKR